MQFNADGEMYMEMRIMENGDCKTDSKTAPYHVTTDVAFIVVEPVGQRPVVMKIAQLKEALLVLEMGRGLVTFKKALYLFSP
ncbi:MAG TPA: hypothetical protein VK084_08395 [Chitinophagaceae bacterium]|nr:hypothetical protein [Chitinophagaceae bacterium]